MNVQTKLKAHQSPPPGGTNWRTRDGVREAPIWPRQVGIAILNFGIRGLEYARDHLAADRGEPQDNPVARERSGAAMNVKRDNMIQPGDYTLETLPPLTPGVEEILTRVKAKAAELRVAREGGSCPRVKASAGHGIVPTDETQPSIQFSDDAQSPVRWP